MLEESRSKHDIFEAWKGKTEYPSFREYWFDLWKKQIDYYFRMGWWIIPLGIRDKKPLGLKNYSWAERSLNYDEALYYAEKDFNLGVVLEKSKLIIIDWDKRALPPELVSWLSKTRTAITGRGWHIYFSNLGDVSEEQYDLMREKLHGKSDMFRGSIQYCVIPMSIVKPRDKKGNELPEPPKVYEWVNDLDIVDFQYFVGDILNDR